MQSTGEIVMYQTADGQTSIMLRWKRKQFGLPRNKWLSYLVSPNLQLMNMLKISIERVSLQNMIQGVNSEFPNLLTSRPTFTI